ncbi:Uncharacterised protein [Mycobacteroides abscessus subsp. abscessus]|nr:Uncharacterised protein [Mycobacteroides abscessus subsp. abscessus]
MSRHRSPTMAGSGGRLLKANMTVASDRLSESRQPPM